MATALDLFRQLGRCLDKQRTRLRCSHERQVSAGLSLLFGRWLVRLGNPGTFLDLFRAFINPGEDIRASSIHFDVRLIRSGIMEPSRGCTLSIGVRGADSVGWTQ